MKNRISLVSLTVVLALSVGLIGCGQGQLTPSLAIFSTSGGNVSVMKQGADDWIEAEVEMSLGPGDIIKSGDNSSAEITFLDGSTIELQGSTQIEIVSLDISTETDPLIIKLKQTIGSMIFRVTKIVDPASCYEVETPAGVVAIRGSAVQITVTEDGTTWACNLEGDIWAVAQGLELQIPEGRCYVMRPGQPPVPAEASSAYIRLNPRSGPPGEQVELEVYGFVADEGIHILFDGSPLIGAIWADNDGRWRVNFMVPVMPPGKYIVTAEGEYTKVQDIFEVTSCLSIVDAANTELQQVQTAVIACMAEAESAELTTWGEWQGGLDVITIVAGNVTYDAGDYIYGPFWATYTVQQDGSITDGYCNYAGGWGDCIIWDPVNNNWVCTPVYVEYSRLLSPAVGSTAVPITDIDFIWTEITGADAYDWGLFSDPDLSSPNAVKSGLTATACTYTGTALAYDTVYYWQVTAYKEGRVINVSTIGTFTTISAPP
jgi:hypothetical protein